jgi:hypothetical protein
MRIVSSGCFNRIVSSGCFNRIVSGGCVNRILSSDFVSRIRSRIIFNGFYTIIIFSFVVMFAGQHSNEEEHFKCSSGFLHWYVIIFKFSSIVANIIVIEFKLISG